VLVLFFAQRRIRGASAAPGMRERAPRLQIKRAALKFKSEPRKMWVISKLNMEAGSLNVVNCQGFKPGALNSWGARERLSIWELRA